MLPDRAFGCSCDLFPQRIGEGEMARVLFLKNNGLGPLLLFFFLLVLFSSCVLTEEEEQHPLKEGKIDWEWFSTKKEQQQEEDDEEEDDEEERAWSTRQTMDPILYPYVLDNECSVNIQHNVTSSPEDQATVFDFISLLVSDVRMVTPDTCRRGSLWIVCNLAFPCQGEDCSVTREDCEYAFKDCPPSDSTLNCSSFPSEDEEKRRYWGGEEKGWVFDERNGASGDSYWVTVEESSQIPNPVTTCLGEDGDDIECCIEPYTMDRNTEECVLKCPAYPFGETRFKAMTYTHFALLWVATIMVVIALFPLCFLKQTLTFPKYAMPAALIASVLWLHNEMWAVYVGLFYVFFVLFCFLVGFCFLFEFLFFFILFILFVGFLSNHPHHHHHTTTTTTKGFEEYVCGEEQDLFVAYDEFLESPTCYAQFYIFHFFGIMSVALIFSVTTVFLYIFTYGVFFFFFFFFFFFSFFFFLFSFFFFLFSFFFFFFFSFFFLFFFLFLPFPFPSFPSPPPPPPPPPPHSRIETSATSKNHSSSLLSALPSSSSSSSSLSSKLSTNPPSFLGLDFRVSFLERGEEFLFLLILLFLLE